MFQRFALLVSSAFLLAAAENAFSATNRYVDSQVGNDAKTCTATAPCKTFARAHSLATSGSKIFLKGTFPRLRISKSGITVTSKSKNQPAFINGTLKSSAGPDCVLIDKVNNVVVSNLKVGNCPRAGIVVAGPGKKNKVLDNEVFNTSQSCIAAAGIWPFSAPFDLKDHLFDTVINGNSVHECNAPSYGVNEAISLANGVSGFEVGFNHVGGKRGTQRQYGVDAKHGARHGWIHDNVIEGFPKHGIYIDGSFYVEDILIEHNLIRNNTNGISLDRELWKANQPLNLRNITVRYNTICNNTWMGFDIHRFSGANALTDDGRGKTDNIVVAYNTFFRNGYSPKTGKGFQASFTFFALTNGYFGYNNVLNTPQQTWRVLNGAKVLVEKNWVAKNQKAPAGCE